MLHDSSSHVHLAAFLFLLEQREVDATTLQITPHQPPSFWRQTQADLPEITPLSRWALPAIRLYLTTDAWMHLDLLPSAAWNLLFSVWHKQSISISKCHCFAPLMSAIKEIQLEMVPYTHKVQSTQQRRTGLWSNFCTVTGANFMVKTTATILFYKWNVRCRAHLPEVAVHYHSAFLMYLKTQSNFPQGLKPVKK